jgi:hypothetical protein
LSGAAVQLQGPIGHRVVTELCRSTSPAFGCALVEDVRQVVPAHSDRCLGRAAAPIPRARRSGPLAPADQPVCVLLASLHVVNPAQECGWPERVQGCSRVRGICSNLRVGGCCRRKPTLQGLVRRCARAR